MNAITHWMIVTKKLNASIRKEVIFVLVYLATPALEEIAQASWLWNKNFD